MIAFNHILIFVALLTGVQGQGMLEMIRNACQDRSGFSVKPEDENETPVTLMLFDSGQTAELPCHYCDEEVGIDGKIWKKKDINGKTTVVKLDTHDDDRRNRVFVDKFHTLYVRNIEPQDTGYYFCYDVGVNGTQIMMDYLLDIQRLSSLAPKKVERRHKMTDLFSCSKLRRVPKLKDFSCVANWGQWTECDRCGKTGERKMIGACRLEKMAKFHFVVQGKLQEGILPITGVGCHSYLLDNIPRAVSILKKVPDVVKIEECLVDCSVYGKAPKRPLVVHKKPSLIKNIKFSIEKFRKGFGFKPFTIEVTEGDPIHLICPGSTVDTPVRWVFNDLTFDPGKIKKSSKGRITIDESDVLHIQSVRISDRGNYICTIFEIKRGWIILKVYLKEGAFDPSTNLGLLSIVLLASFLVYVCIISFKARTYLEAQSNVAKRRREMVDLRRRSIINKMKKSEL